MSYVIVEYPVEGGGVLRVQEDEDSLPDGLVPVARRGKGPLVLRAKESVEAALDQIKPAISATAARLRAMAADEVSVEFGLVLGIEGGPVIAKSTAEVHFTVTLTWRRDEEAGGEEPAPDA